MKRLGSLSRASLSLLVSASALGLLAGCGSGGSGSRGSASTVAPATSAAAPVSSSVATPGTTTAPTPPAKQPPVAEWLKGDFHVHSNHSGDATSIGDPIDGVIRCAEVAGLDFTTISDHRTTACLTDPKFTGAQTKLILIPGEEWGGPGHAGAHGLTRDPIFHEQQEAGGPQDCVQKIEQTIDDIHSMGGIFLVNHPMDSKCAWFWPISKLDGMEVWNQSWAFRSADDMTQQEADSWIANHKMSPASVMPWSASLKALQVKGGGQNLQRLRLYENLLDEGRHIAAVGGGDSHYVFLPGYPTTQVLAESRTMAGVLDAVRKGRTQVLRSPNAPQLEFTADRDGDGVFESVVGDSIPLGATVTFRLKIKGADGGKVEIRRNGQVAQSWTINSADWAVTWKDTPTAKSWYRVDCWEKLDLTFPHANTLKNLTLQAQTFSWLNALAAANLLNGKLASLVTNAQKIIDAGGPAALYLLLYAKDFGITIAPTNTAFPRLIVPENVVKVLNIAVHDRDYCPAVFTSAIWVE